MKGTCERCGEWRKLKRVKSGDGFQDPYYDLCEDCAPAVKD